MASVFSFFTLLQLATLSRARVNLVNNGYSTVVVAIKPGIPYDESLLTAIRKQFTDASKYLYTATRRRAYFKDITILVPQTWPNRYPNAAGETFNTAEIRIERADSDTAYVCRTAECGTTNGEMHLTPNRIKGQAYRQSPPYRMLVHEWGHLRWGVFDEYAYPHQQAAYVQNGRLVGTACSVQMSTTGMAVDSNGNPCSSANVRSCSRYIPPNPTDSKASIMYIQQIQSVTSFCTDNGEDGVRHNKQAPNDQNNCCEHRSTWNVIVSHPDFRNRANPPGSLNRDTRPTFKIVRAQKPSYVLATDRSRSMRYEGRIVQFRQAARTLIDSAPDGTRIAIVVFDSEARVRANLTTIRTPADREALIGSLPDVDELISSDTNTSAGLCKALEVLTGQSDGYLGNVTDVGGNIVLVTDGEETDDSTIADVTPLLVAAKVKVYPIGTGPTNSSELDRLASDTGGSSFFVNSSDTGLSGTASMYAALAAVVDGGRASGTVATAVQVLSTSTDVAPSTRATGSFMLDSGVGVNTTVSVAWSTAVDAGLIPQVKIVSPSGIVANNSAAYFASEFMILDFQLNGKAKMGRWSYTVSNPSGSWQTVTTVVTTHPSSPNPIILSAHLSDSEVLFPEAAVISADIMMGSKFVRGANVTAIVSRPISTSVTIILHDNGIAPDRFEDDGIYSAFFTQYTGDGPYNVIVKASAATNEARAADYNQTGDVVFDDQSASNDNIDNSQPVEAFVRSIAAGVLTLGGYTGQDLMPPARITDLTVIGTNYPNLSVTLQWTAPGDDAYTGNAVSCNLRLATDFDDLINTTVFNKQRDVARSDVLSGSVDPLPGGSTQHVTVRVADGVADREYYAALVCTDEVDNPSRVSNIVRFILTDGTSSTPSGSGKNTGQMMTVMTTTVVVLLVVM